METILLLFALKIKFNEHIYLLRGHHEDINVNKCLGLAEECALKFKEDVNDPNSIFQLFNQVIFHKIFLSF